MNERDLLEWLAVQVDSEPINDQDLLNGFVLLQLISLISPSSVDLTWYTTPEAWDCPNISLRNYVTLSKGIKYIASNIPDKLTTSFSYNKSLLNEKLQLFERSIKSISDTVLQNAKAGELDACKQIMVELYNIWNLTQMEEESNKVTTAAIKAEKEDDYIPTERTFRPMIQWMLLKIKCLLVRHPLHSQSKLIETVNALYLKSSQSDKQAVPKSIIQTLCDCQVYNLLNKLMFQSKETKSLENNLDFKPESFSIFLDNLVKKGFLNIKANLLQSIKDMIRDQTPFYEHDELKSLVEEITEFDDLAQDLENGWMMCFLIAGYYPDKTREYFKKIKVGAGLSKVEVEKNYKLLQELTELASKDLVVPWKPIDIISSMDNQNVSSGNVSYLFVSFLARFMSIVQKKNLSFLPTKTALKELKAKRRLEADLKKLSEKDTTDLVEIHADKGNVATDEIQITNTETILKKEPMEHLVTQDIVVDSRLNPKEDKPAAITQNDTQAVRETNLTLSAIDIPSGSKEKKKRKGSSRKKKLKPLDNDVKEFDHTFEEYNDSNTKQQSNYDENQAISKVGSSEDIAHEMALAENPKPKRKSSSSKSRKSSKVAGSEMQESTCHDNPLLHAKDIITEQIEANQFSGISNVSKKKSRSGRKSKSIETPSESENSKQESTNDMQFSAETLSIIETEPKIDLFDTENHLNNEVQPNDNCINDTALQKHNMESLPKKKVKSGKKSSRKQKALLSEPIFDETPILGSSPTQDIQNIFPSNDTVGDAKFSLPALVVPKAAEKSTVPKVSNVDHLPNIFDTHSTEGRISDSEKDNSTIENNQLYSQTKDFEEQENILQDNPVDSTSNDVIQQTPVVKEHQTSIRSNASCDSDEDMDDDTWNMILKIRNSSEKLIEESKNIATLSRESKNTVGANKSEKEAQFEKIKFEDTLIDSDDDFSYIPSNRGGTATAAEESHQILKPVSRPRTGLQTYPLPETDDESEQKAVLDLNDSKGEESWQRVQKMKRLAKLTPKSKALKRKNDSAEILTDAKVVEPVKVEELKHSPVKSKQEKEEEIARKKLEQVALQEQVISEKLRKRSEKITESARQTPKPPKATSSKLRKSLSTKSNKNLIKNALMHVCLAGNLHKGVKEEVLQDLAESDANHFVILLRDVNNFAFRGLYFWDPNLDQTLKLYSGSPGPTELDPAGVLEFYKYDSGARTFKPIPTKSFGRTVDAIAIGRDYFVPNK
ncbi:hypothetical protein HDV06_000102 [Boothiomyces sp. JEL0866]|nr:hypothetical protein HDV06_000102 [Boothiomyces sp. JEL0866]